MADLLDAKDEEIDRLRISLERAEAHEQSEVASLQACSSHGFMMITVLSCISSADSTRYEMQEMLLYNVQIAQVTSNGCFFRTSVVSAEALYVCRHSLLLKEKMQPRYVPRCVMHLHPQQKLKQQLLQMLQLPVKNGLLKQQSWKKSETRSEGQMKRQLPVTRSSFR